MMEREQLEKMPMMALRTLATERGLADAEALERADLIDRLDRLSTSSSAAHRLVERAKEAIAEAAHRVEARAHQLAERMKPEAPRAPAPQPKSARPLRSGFDVPSSTVHPRPEELESLTMARMYVVEGHLDRALEILEKLAALDPADENVGAELEALRGKLPQARPEPEPRPAAPAEPLWMLDLEELPEVYGVDECEVLYKDPYWVFAYWEVTDGGLQAARAQLGPSAGSARLVLRLFTTPGAHGGDREVHDIDLHGHHGRRYLPSVRPGAHLRVAVGLLSSEGYFAPIAHSSLMRIPHAEPAEPGPVEWMEVVPGRTRGKTREPLVLVRRGAGHTERGVDVAFERGRDGGPSSPRAPFGGPSSPGGK
jgi:hypothetical protein